jgi:POT family proton-dependent oligopeptide transporter
MLYQVVVHLADQREELGYDDLMKGDNDAVDHFFSEQTKCYFKDSSLVYREGAAYYMYTTFAPSTEFSPELFQPFNPSFIVILTPIILGIFAWLNKRGKEPTAPRKIGYGMIITSFAFLILLIGSLGLDPFASLSPDSPRIGVSWLIGTYFMMTVAELFLSPMGISFVSKVSPPKYQGLMQGGWLGATALGNQMLWVGSYLYERIPIWQVWLVFIVLTLIAAGFIFSIMKKLDKVSK